MTTQLPVSGVPPRLEGGVPFFAHYLEYRRDPLAFWLRAGRTAPVTQIQFGPAQRFWLITDPEIAEHLLLKAVKDHPRDRRIMALNSRGGPEVMFSTDRWEEWRWRRRLIQPAFHRQHIARFADTIVAHARRVAAEMADAAEVDVEAQTRRLTIRIILETMFSVTDDTAVGRLHANFESGSEFTFRRAAAPVALPLWFPSRSNRTAEVETRERIDVLRSIVESRVGAGPQGDFLDVLITARLDDEEGGHTLSTEQLVHEMSGIVFAGHETTAATLTWLLYLLSTHPEAEALLRTEIADMLGDRPIAFDDLESLPYLDHCVQETLRLYPPVYVTVREADSAGEVAGYRIPKGTRFVVNIRGLHRDPTAWGDPDTFRPERFAEPGANRHRFQYLPFLGGPKKCLGDTFAMMEIRLAAATLLQHLSFSYIGGEPARERPTFTMAVDGGMPMRVTRR
jgi:cytochrome P450